MRLEMTIKRVKNMSLLPSKAARYVLIQYRYNTIQYHTLNTQKYPKITENTQNDPKVPKNTQNYPNNIFYSSLTTEHTNNIRLTT